MLEVLDRSRLEVGEKLVENMEAVDSRCVMAVSAEPVAGTDTHLLGFVGAVEGIAAVHIAAGLRRFDATVAVAARTLSMAEAHQLAAGVFASYHLGCSIPERPYLASAHGASCLYAKLS